MSACRRSAAATGKQDAEKITAYLTKTMNERIMVLDGAMGTTIQQYKFNEADFRGAPSGVARVARGDGATHPGAPDRGDPGWKKGRVDYHYRERPEDVIPIRSHDFH